MMAYGVVLFHTTSSAMRAERVLLQAGYTIRLIPTPRQLSSNCGMALRFDWEQYEPVRSALEKAQVEIDSIHQMERD